MRATRTTAGVQSTLHELAEALEGEVDGLVETMLGRMHDEVPDFDVWSRPELDHALRDSCYGNVRLALRALGSDRQPPSTTPAEAVEEARVTARTGVSLQSLLHTYRVGHAVVWERMLDLAQDQILQDDERHATLRIGSRYLFSYIDALCSLVTQEYTRERDRVMRSNIQRRVQLVRDVLAGATVSASELGYDLNAEHIASVAEGPDAETVLHTTSRHLDCNLLTIAVAGDIVWGWLGAGNGLSKTAFRRLGTIAIPPGTQLALGEPGWGATGFRDSHQQAQASHRVGTRLHQPITRYDDVALEAAILSDGRAGRPFVDRELGPLLQDGDRGTRLRRTLEAYLKTGLNASSAGALLGVSDRTVAYRIQTIEGMLGRTVPGRIAELAAALKLHTLYSDND